MLRSLSVFVMLAGVLVFVAVIRGVFDPDYFWHLATGRLILDERSIPMSDPFSFTWAGRPWTPDQWLAEVAIAAGTSAIGTAGVLALFAMAAAVGPAAIAAAALRRGARLIAVVLVAALAGLALLPQVTIRPQVVSFAFLGLLLWILLEANDRWRLRLWILPPMFLLWANIHGFFVIGLAVGFVYLVATLWGRTPLRNHRLLVLLVAGASVVATMVTPSGPGGLLYALSFANPADLGAARIQEWQSPDFHNLQFVAFLAVVLLVLARGGRGRPGWWWAIGLMGMGIGLFAARAVGVGVILAMPLLVVPVQKADALASHPDGSQRALMELVTAAVVCAVLVGSALLAGPVTVDRRRVPVEGTAILARELPDAHVLASYEWGGYVTEQLYPRGARVFVDGRMHKYAPDVMSDYVHIVSGDPGWAALVRLYGVQVILLDPDATLVKGVAQHDGWCERYRDDVQVLLLPCETAGP